MKGASVALVLFAATIACSRSGTPAPDPVASPSVNGAEAAAPAREDIDDLDAAPPSHWRIEWNMGGEWDSTTTTFDDKGRLTRIDNHRAWDQLLQAFPTEVIEARNLLTELQRRGQLWPASTRPPEPPSCQGCSQTNIRVTLDGVEYFVNLTANDPRDLAPRRWMGAGTHDDWPNHRADRLIVFLSSIGQAHMGELNVRGALGLDSVKPTVSMVYSELFPTCYFHSTDAGAPRLPGTITVQFVIDPSGTVSTVNHEAPSKATDEHDAKIIACVVKQFKDVFKDMTFPKPADGAPVYVSCQVLFGP